MNNLAPINMIKEHPYMWTFSGNKMYPGALEENFYHIIDIAHGLGVARRFGNQSDMFYSVAQHSVHVSSLVPQRFALHALLHDASEAYTNDMTKPIKMLLPDFEKFEDELSASIYKQFNLSEELPVEVEAVDSRIVIDEALVVFKNKPEWAVENKSSRIGIKIIPWTEDEAMLKWYRRFLYLTAPSAYARNVVYSPATEARLKRTLRIDL